MRIYDTPRDFSRGKKQGGLMKRITLGTLLLVLTGGVFAVPEKVTPEMAEEKGYLSCHQGIEDFTEGRMWDDILEQGALHNDENGCVVCHGGKPLGTTKEEAHKGSPASLVKKGGPKLFLRNSVNDAMSV
jgi:hypothetical protein